MKKALYPGSFDPVTNGHLDVIRRATRLFDRIIVAVGENTEKQPIFTLEERLRHLQETCSSVENVEITSFSGLLNKAVTDFGACAVIRGLRAVSDFEWEFQMALMNRELNPDCETLFLMPSPEFSFISSTMIREIVRLKGDVRPFVPDSIVSEIEKKLH